MFRSVWLASVLLVLVDGDTPKVGDHLLVTVFQTGLKPGKSRLSKDVATLKEGDEIEVTSVDKLWLGARSKGVDGFVLANVVAPRGEIRLSAQSQTSTVSVEDRNAAQKGFTPEIEKEYRRQHASLEADFAVVDRIETRTVPVDELGAFVQSGQLGGR